MVKRVIENKDKLILDLIKKKSRVNLHEVFLETGINNSTAKKIARELCKKGKIRIDIFQNIKIRDGKERIDVLSYELHSSEI